MSVCVVIRGESFRQLGKQHNRNTNDDPTLQMKCSESHIKHIIRPLQEMYDNVYVELHTYSTTFDHLLLKPYRDICTTKLVLYDKNKETQESLFEKSTKESVMNRCVIRFDLLFKQNIQITEPSKVMFLYYLSNVYHPKRWRNITDKGNLRICDTVFWIPHGIIISKFLQHDFLDECEHAIPMFPNIFSDSDPSKQINPIYDIPSRETKHTISHICTDYNMYGVLLRDTLYIKHIPRDVIISSQNALKINNSATLIFENDYGTHIYEKRDFPGYDVEVIKHINKELAKKILHEKNCSNRSAQAYST
tara:strand:- start:6466 stop:7383 length:918 start_codon:yes stop_codon:yes gene_type:complete